MFSEFFNRICRNASQGQHLILVTEISRTSHYALWKCICPTISLRLACISIANSIISFCRLKTHGSVYLFPNVTSAETDTPRNVERTHDASSEYVIECKFLNFPSYPLVQWEVCAPARARAHSEGVSCRADDNDTFRRICLVYRNYHRTYSTHPRLLLCC